MKTYKSINLIFALIFAFTLIGIPSTALAQDPEIFFDAQPYNGWIHARGWPVDTTLIFEIDDPADGLGDVDYTDTAVVYLVDGDPNNTQADFPWPEQFTLGPEYVITARGNELSKTMTFLPFKITNVDIEADTVSGIGVSGSQIQVEADGLNGAVYRWVNVDSSSNWMANFHELGTGQDTPDTVDIQPGSGGDAAMFIGIDRLYYPWSVPDVPTANFSPSIQASTQYDYVRTQGWPEGIMLDLTINNGEFSAQAESVALPNPRDSNDIMAFFDLQGYDIQPGNLLTVSGGGVTKTLLVGSVAVTSVDAETDTVSGITDQFADITVWACDNLECAGRNPTGDEYGYWTADFSIPELGGDGSTHNLVPGTSGGFNQFDEDADWTEGDWRVPNVDNTFFIVRPNEERIEGTNWFLYSTPTVSIDDPLTPSNPDATVTTACSGGDWDPNHASFQVTFNNYDIKVGDIVTVTDGATTKQTIVSNLAITGFDLDAGTVWGIAESNKIVTIVTGHGGIAAIREEEANNDGNWIANFGIQGDQPFEQDTPDLRGEPGFSAYVNDEDGDNTSIWFQIPTFIVSPNEDRIEGSAWKIGSPVTVAIDDPSTPANPDTTVSATVGVADWDPNQTWFQVNIDDYDIKVGDIVTVTDGTSTKQTIVSNIAITGFDLDADTFWGVAESNQTVYIKSGGNGIGVNREEKANQDGNWDTNVGIPGDLPGELETWDLRAGSGIGAFVNDVDGDSSMYFMWIPSDVPTPNFPQSIQASALYNYVQAQGWPENIMLDLTISGTGGNYSTQAESASDGQNNTIAFFELQGYDIQPGDSLTVSGGDVTKILLVGSVAVTSASAGTDIVTGTADPGTWLSVWVCDNTHTQCANRNPTVDEDGTWTTNFSEPDSQGGEIIDLVPGMNGNASQDDDDGDKTFAEWRVISQHFDVRANTDEILAYGWPMGTLMDLTINGTDGIYNTTTLIGYAPWNPGDPNDILAVFDMQGYDIQSGDLITISNNLNSTILTSTVTPLAFDVMDKDTDTVSGFAASFSNVDLWAYDSNWNTYYRHVTADEDGKWIADWSVVGTLPDEQNTLDFCAGDNGSWCNWVESQQQDEFGNRTLFTMAVPNPIFTVRANLDQIEALGWRLGNIVTLTIDDPGSQANPDFEDTLTIVQSPWQVNTPHAFFNLWGIYDIQPGFLVTLSNGSITKTHTVTHLAFTDFDIDLDTVSGTSEPGAPVHVSASDNSGNWSTRDLFGDSFGEWTADWSVIGSQPYYQDSFDLVAGTSVDSQEGDDDGDQTLFGLLLMDSSGDFVIGPNGGQVITSNNNVNLVIPAGALEEELTFSITDGGDGFIVQTDQGEIIAVASFTIGPEGTIFATPITITFHWPDADNDGVIDGTSLMESDLVVSKDGIEIAVCTDNPNCDVVANTISVQVSSLSYFVLGATSNQPPEISSITAPSYPMQIGQFVNVAVNFTDPDINDTHTITWVWGDGSTSNVLSASASHFYAQTGVYTINITVTDAAGESDSAAFEYVVVYDPTGGFVTGGGWIESPLGAYTPNPDMTGKATFGFVSKYQKGANVPTGNTEFQFKTANFTFSSTSYDWLVIAGSKAQYKGTGTINNAGIYAFMLTASDGTPDRFRIKIWDKTSGEVIYDNQLGAGDNAELTTAIQGGSITVHKAE